MNRTKEIIQKRCSFCKFLFYFIFFCKDIEFFLPFLLLYSQIVYVHDALKSFADYTSDSLFANLICSTKQTGFIVSVYGRAIFFFSFFSFSIVSFVWFRYRPVFVAILRLRNVLRAMESVLWLLPHHPDTDYPMRPTRICEVSFGPVNCPAE